MQLQQPPANNDALLEKIKDGLTYALDRDCVTGRIAYITNKKQTPLAVSFFPNINAVIVNNSMAGIPHDTAFLNNANATGGTTSAPPLSNLFKNLRVFVNRQNTDRVIIFDATPEGSVVKSASSKMFWIDVETTGLDSNKDIILEVALVVTQQNTITSNLDIIDSVTVQIASSLLKIYNASTQFEWVINNHEKNGLLPLCMQSQISISEAEEVLCEMIKKHAEEYIGKIPMCGSSVHFDRGFIEAHMPRLNTMFSYRNIDASVFLEILKTVDRHPPAAKLGVSHHRAYPDLLNTIARFSKYNKLITGTRIYEITPSYDIRQLHIDHF